MNITSALLKTAEPANTDAYYDSIAPLMDQHARTYGIDTPIRVAHFLAQIGHESKFKIAQENGNYSATRMRQVFGCKGGQGKYDAAADDCTAGRLREKLWTEEGKYANNAANLLSYAYASRLGNGDEASGEGFKYRGRGMIQLTGKTNYSKFTTAHNKKNPADQRDFVANPDLVATDLNFGVESAFYFWDARNINAIADTDDVRDVTIAVNGGENGLPDRTARLTRIKQALGI